MLATALTRRRRRSIVIRSVALLSALALTAAFVMTATAADTSSSSGNPCPSDSCLLRFANQPDTTETNLLIKDGYDSTGNAIRVEIYDPNTGQTVNSNAAVTLILGFNPAGGTLTGGAATAVAGVATFPSLSINRPGPYKLLASSPVAAESELSDQFMVSNTVTACTGTGCFFREIQGGNSYTTTPKNGIAGSGYATTLNLPGLRVSCDFAPFFYSDARQPNSVWYVYDDGGSSIKTNVIVISKSIVQITPENGSSKYRVCYSSPEPFIDRTGNLAQPDPWSDGPSAYFGETWYTGLLPDCGKKNPESKAPCSLSWVASSSGDRVGTFLTPPGDPSYR
jgi:hypothetical protein